MWEIIKNDFKGCWFLSFQPFNSTLCCFLSSSWIFRLLGNRWVVRQGAGKWLAEVVDLFEADIRTYESIMVNWRSKEEIEAREKPDRWCFSLGRETMGHWLSWVGQLISDERNSWRRAWFWPANSLVAPMVGFCHLESKCFADERYCHLAPIPPKTILVINQYGNLYLGSPWSKSQVRS